ncbi:MAG: PDZ domain-containing protein [Planctomycetaceae bacterium]|nr:PDZ domain-containing protein [Planctomycetaceae bacterium]
MTTTFRLTTIVAMYVSASLFGENVSVDPLTDQEAIADSVPVVVPRVDPVVLPSVEPALATPVEPRRDWIGVRIAPVPPAMRHQMDLPSFMGLVVNQVTPGTPAARAGLLRYDILTRATIDGKEYALASAQDLRSAIRQADQSGLTLEVIRDRVAQTVTVTPEPIPPALVARQRSSYVCDDPLCMPSRSQIIVLPVMQNAVAVQPLPPDVTMTVTRTGTEPPVILVARNGEEWRVADGNWGGLPADLQPFVAPMMAANNPAVAVPVDSLGNAVVAPTSQLPAGTVAREADVRELRREIEELKQLVRQSLNDR